MRNQALIAPKDGAPDTLSEDLQALAAQVAKDLVPPEMIVGQWGLSMVEYQALLASPEFDALLQVERARWWSPENTNERVRAKSLMSIEDGLLTLSEIVKDVEAGPIARIKAFAELVRTGGADNAGLAKAKAAGAGAGGAGERFSISIHLGGVGEKKIAGTRVIDVEPAVADEPAVAGEPPIEGLSGW